MASRKHKKITHYNPSTPPSSPIFKLSKIRKISTINITTQTIQRSHNVISPRFPLLPKRSLKKHNKSRNITSFDILCHRLGDYKKYPVLPVNINRDSDHLGVTSPSSCKAEPPNTPTTALTPITPPPWTSMYLRHKKPEKKSHILKFQKQSVHSYHRKHHKEEEDDEFDDDSLCCTLYPYDTESVQTGVHYTKYQGMDEFNYINYNDNEKDESSHYSDDNETQSDDDDDYNDYDDDYDDDEDEIDDYHIMNKRYDYDNNETVISTSDGSNNSNSNSKPCEPAHVAALFNHDSLPKIEYLQMSIVHSENEKNADYDHMKLPPIPTAKPITPLTPDTPDSELSGFTLNSTNFPDIVVLHRHRDHVPMAPSKKRYSFKRNSVLLGTNWE